MSLGNTAVQKHTSMDAVSGQRAAAAYVLATCSRRLLTNQSLAIRRENCLQGMPRAVVHTGQMPRAVVHTGQMPRAAVHTGQMPSQLPSMMPGLP
eukprot:357183-Chlamydomonas_euryale.AAC.2